MANEPPSLGSMTSVIYCVVPEALADELFPKLESYYADDPHVTVIVDRRKSSRREGGSSGGGSRGARSRDRRRPRVTGEMPELRERRALGETQAVPKVVVHVDGGARGNPGPAAVGVVVSAPGGAVLEEFAERIGVASNNVAEYRALLCGVERAAAVGAARGGVRQSTPSSWPSRSTASTRSSTRR